MICKVKLSYQKYKRTDSLVKNNKKNKTKQVKNDQNNHISLKYALAIYYNFHYILALNDFDRKIQCIMNIKTFFNQLGKL